MRWAASFLVAAVVMTCGITCCEAESHAASAELTAQDVERLRDAAEQGEAVAQNNLGLMYMEGRGVSQDDTKAVEWYRKAAEQGLAVAQFYLGSMYQEGRGVAQNSKEAYRWYYTAGQLGNSNAANARLELTQKGLIFDADVSANDAARIRREMDEIIRQRGWK